MENCFYHGAAEATATCSGCGKPLCDQCWVELLGTRYCGECRHQKVAEMVAGGDRWAGSPAASSDPMAVPPLREVLVAAWKVNRNNYLTILAITLIVYVPMDVALSFVPGNDFIVYFRIDRGLEFWFGTIAELALIQVAFAGNDGTRIPLGAALKRAFACYGPGLWTSFLYNIGVTLRLLLLIIPGVIAAVNWLFATQIVVIRGISGQAALVESERFVKGRWWRLFQPAVRLGLLLVLGGVLTGLAIEFAPASRVLEVLLGVPVRLCSAYIAICLTQLYLRSGPGGATKQ